jgi:3-phenylpropionate/cinnamic acid dioxygenase small subunit
MDESVIGQLADQLAIRDLIARVAQLADLGTLDEYSACFTADATWQPPASAAVPLRGGTRSGVADIRAGVTERRADGVQGPGSHTQHVVSTVSVALDGPDRAHSRAYWRYYAGTDQTPRLLSMGYYDDELARTDEGWRIASRRITSG